MDIDLGTALSGLDINADWIGIRMKRENVSVRSVRNGKPERNSRNDSFGVMVEVLKDGVFGYSCTNRVTLEGIREAARGALAQAQAAAALTVFKFDAGARPPESGSFRSNFRLAKDTLSPGDINELLIKACESMKVSDQILDAKATAALLETETRLVSSSGADVEQKTLVVASGMEAIASHLNVIQKRSNGGYMAQTYQTGLELISEGDYLETARRVGEEALELVHAEVCPEERMSLVLAPDQMMLQIHESIGHPLELDRILGDERNYAGSSFVKLKDFGSLQYGSEVMNVTFDPSLEGELASYGFDDGGEQAEKTYIIEKGLLKTALGSRESRLRAGVPGVANFRASSWNRAPIDRMANLNLEAGDSSFEEIIGAVERGVYMQSNLSWSIDDYRNKFQFGCEYARLIENGKLTKTLRNPNYRGVTTPFWNSLRKVGDASTFQVFGTPHCGKGEPNQMIQVGHASPVCLFDNIEIFGETL